MRTRSSAEMIVHAWECSLYVPEWQRAPALLAALSGRSLEETLALGIARRDSYLVEWRVALFGPKWVAFASCPDCASMLEYELPISTSPPSDSTDEFAITLDHRTWHVRWPSTLELVKAASSATRTEARDLLIQGCIPNDASPSEAQQLIETLAARHSAFSTVKLSCSECGKAWEAVHDIGEFLWREVCVTAKRLLCEVDTIARVYGWTESEILALSQNRRNCYLEMVQ